MKKVVVLVLLLAASFCPAKDVYARATVVSGDSVSINGRTYRLWGIRSAGRGWDRVAIVALARMVHGKELKYLVDRKHPGVVRLGLFGRDGRPQINPCLKLLKMGLATYVRTDRPDDPKVHAPYRASEDSARRNKVGIWSD